MWEPPRPQCISAHDMSVFGGPEGDSEAVRTMAFQQRDTAGVLHPGTEDDYDTALSHQWGGK